MVYPMCNVTLSPFTGLARERTSSQVNLSSQFKFVLVLIIWSQAAILRALIPWVALFCITKRSWMSLISLGSSCVPDLEQWVDMSYSQWPMQPRNPDSTGSAGGPNASQTQSWVSGPNESGTAVVVLANYGPDEGSGGFGTSDNDIQLVTVSLDTLGLGGQSWSVRRVLGGGGSGGGDFSDLGVTSDQLSCNLGPGESVLYKLQQQ